MVYKNSELKHCSLYDRVEKLLVSFEWSDCCFSVSGKNFKAHKLILAITSPVFEAMFYGPLSTNDIITIADIEHDIFQLLLNYIYTDKVKISSIEQAFELLYASRKYLLEHLTDICIAYIQANISVDNVISVLNYPDYMQDKQLISFSLKLFCEHAKFILSESKKNISHSCMKAILESEQMNIGEKDLIKHVFEWTMYYCKQNNILQTFENRRQVLMTNGLFKLLRLLTLSLDELNEINTDANNLLLPNEAENIKNIIKTLRDIDSKVVIDSIGMTLTPRNCLKLQWYLCHRRPLKSVSPVVIDFNNYIIHTRIKTNRSVFINSLCVPTRVAPVHFYSNTAKVYSEQLSVSIVCELDNSIVKFTNFLNTVEYNSIVDIELSEPCFIKKDIWYKISFIWPQNRYHTHTYIVECRDRNYNDQKVTFEFDDSSLIAGAVGSFLEGLKYCL